MIWELFGACAPIVDLRILRNPIVAAGSALALINGFNLFGIIVMLPQFTQTNLNFTATVSGQQVLLRALAVAAFTPVTLLALKRLKIRPVSLIATGFVVITGANVVQAFSISTDSSFWTFATPLIVGGIGFAMIGMPLNVAVLQSVAQSQTPKVASFITLAQQLGGSTATGVLISLADRRFASHFSALGDSVTLRTPEILAFMARFGREPLVELVRAQAAALSFADVSWILAVVTAIAVPLCYVIRRRNSAHIA